MSMASPPTRVRRRRNLARANGSSSTITTRTVFMAYPVARPGHPSPHAVMSGY
ncbi:hypothetical protein [Lysobacter gummosus]|uniref:hypothetical protein n=1 Tax=Lysobacter gummosus TaxID=262324 RepID=UPI00363507C9